MLRAHVALLTFLAGSLSLSACMSNASSVVPRGVTAGALRPNAAGASTIPFYRSSFAYGGQTYPFTMVGSNPLNAGRTTTVTAVIVPVKLSFSNGVALDPTALAPDVVKSPLFTAAPFVDGTAQFGDAVMRAEFWSFVKKKHYHVLLSAAPIAPTVTLSVPSTDGYTASSRGATLGYLSFSWFVQTMEPLIVAQLKIPPTELTIFVTYHTDVLEPGSHCCYRGYHYSFTPPGASGTWTTAWASVTKNNVEVLSHEVAEWLNDPFYTNAVPAWIEPETGACGGALLEVGDPVTNHAVRTGGFRLQDIAFFSWFTRQTPSIAFGGRYDLDGDLKAPAANCT